MDLQIDGQGFAVNIFFEKYIFCVITLVIMGGGGEFAQTSA